MASTKRWMLILVIVVIVLAGCQNTKLKDEFYGRQDNITEKWRAISADIQKLTTETPNKDRPGETIKLLDAVNRHKDTLNSYEKFVRDNRKDLNSMKINVNLALSEIDSDIFYAEQQRVRLVGYKGAVEEESTFAKRYADMLTEYGSLKKQAANSSLPKSEKLGLLNSLKLKTDNYDTLLLTYESFLFGKKSELQDMGYDIDSLQLEVTDKRSEIYAYRLTVINEANDLAQSVDYALKVNYLNSVMTGVYNQYSAMNYSLLEYEYTNNENVPVTITFSAEIKGYTPFDSTAEVIQPKQTKRIRQSPLFYSNAADQLTEMKYADLHYQIRKEWQNLDEKTVPITMYAKDTMVWAVQKDGKWVSTAYLIGAWVTPHVDEIDKVVRLSAELKDNHAMTGYQCSYCSLESEYREFSGQEVGAIYTVLQSLGITYVNSPVSFSLDSDSSQRIKLPKDAIRLASANCIDGVVLFASALENIGMSPYIALVPGHAFLCWDISEDPSKGVDCVETTMLGGASYKDANAVGRQEFIDYLSKGEISMLPVQAIRQLGITPME